ATTLAAWILEAIPPTAVALSVPPASFSIRSSTCATVESVVGLAFPKFSITPSTVVRTTSKSAGNRQATSAESWSLSPNFNSVKDTASRSEEHTSELQSLRHLVCRLLLEKKKNKTNKLNTIHRK